MPAAIVSTSRRKRFWRVLSVVALAVLGIGLAVFALADDRRREIALQDCRKGKFADAEPVLKELLAQKPDDIEVLECLARGYVAEEKFAQAEPYLSKLVELRPTSIDYLQRRVEVYRKLKRRDKALTDTKHLLELDPTDSKQLHAAMGLAFAIGNFADAEDYCRQLLSQQPADRPFLRSMLAQIRRARGDDQEAAEILDELIRDNPNDYAALLARGTLYVESNQPDLAIPLLQKVFDKDRTRRRTSGYQLGMALGKVGKNDEAEKVLSEVRRLQDVENFEAAIQNRPGDLDLQVRLGQDLIRDGHDADGIKLLEDVIKKAPNHAGAHRALASVYEKQGKAELAAKHRHLGGGSR